MTAIPTSSAIAAVKGFLQDGYDFIRKRSQQEKSDVFIVDFYFEKVICMHGKEAASVFYDPAKFKRADAIPKRIQKTLLGENGIQTLDGEKHRIRKKMFMSLMTPERIQFLRESFSRHLYQHANRWGTEPEIVLMNEMKKVLCVAACEWVGVPLPHSDIARRSYDLADMVDAFGAVGPRHSRGRDARERSEKWIADLVVAVRENKINTPSGSPLDLIASLHEEDDTHLSAHMAAIEIINLLRPIVAISTYITFGALAMHQYPESREKLRSGDAAYLENFVQEVRRFFPFAPFTGARVASDFTWRGVQFKKGMLTFLDIYGTNHDPRVWKSPQYFFPDRFSDWDEDPFNFIPQGGGNHMDGHRCAGERITIDITKEAMRFLSQQLSYRLPPQDFHYSLTRLPTFPASGFVMREVKTKRTDAAGRNIVESVAGTKHVV